jgi:sulfite exporter TauE/SafE
VGLLGGVHCAGMCGGLVGAFSMNLPPRARTVRLHLAYNGGRITSYAIAGLVAGAIGEAGLLLNNVLPVQLALYVAANLMLVALGLYLAGVSRLLSSIESVGARLWRVISPLGRRWLPADTPGKAYRLGLVWGWLPCGLVYSVLATAIFTGDAASGAAIMLAFGLGTLPNLMLAGLFWKKLRDFFAQAVVRAVAGGLVLALGVAGLARASGHAEALRAGVVCHFF